MTHLPASSRSPASSPAGRGISRAAPLPTQDPSLRLNTGFRHDDSSNIGLNQATTGTRSALTDSPNRATVAEYRGRVMKPVLLAIAVILVSGILARQAFSQAAAESVLTHGLASGASSSMGKTLGNAIGHAAGTMGNRLGQQTSPSSAQQRIQVVKPKNSPTPASPTAPVASTTSGSLIASIQGGSSSTVTSPCAPAVRPETAAPAKTDTSSGPSAEKPPAASKNCVVVDANAHPSVVNLPPAN